MKKRFSFWGTIIIFVLAVLLHSLFDITKLEIFKPISPANESVWEHMKMIFFAGLLYYLFSIIFSGGKKTRYLVGYAVSLIVMVLLVPMIFYTYTNIIGKHLMAVDILITLVAAFSGEFIAYKLRPKYNTNPNSLALFIAGFVILLMIFMFVYFTYYPLNTPIFISS